jgi:hypothetical protein
MPIDRLSLLPTGTTSNEALHAEINSWLRQTQDWISEDSNHFTEPLDTDVLFILIGGGNLQKCYTCITLLEPPWRLVYGDTEWFRGYAGIFAEPKQAMHKSTLELKLNCLLTSKLLAHNAALFTPTTRQMSASMVLAFSCHFWLLCGIWFWLYRDEKTSQTD